MTTKFDQCQREMNVVAKHVHWEEIKKEKSNDEPPTIDNVMQHTM